MRKLSRRAMKITRHTLRSQRTIPAIVGKRLTYEQLKAPVTA